MKKQSQLEVVAEQMLRAGYVTRNWCLERRITRLAAIIAELKKAGMGFTAGKAQGDYLYRLKKLDVPQQLELAR